MKVGILALQGAVKPHAEKLSELGITPIEVRTPSDLNDLSGIILPGGESSAMIHLLKLNRLWEPLSEFARYKPTWGVCAGSILLAKSVTNPLQESLALMDIEVIRNGYGRQNESFVDEISATKAWKGNSTFEGIFIRAPRITTLSQDVQVLFLHKNEPVMVQQGHLMASTFHPELTSSTELHQYFQKVISEWIIDFQNGSELSSKSSTL